MTKNSVFPEILSPVANWEMCQAAVQNGADAIYIGMPKFNARGRTAELSPEVLKEMIKYCHLFGVKVYLAFNVLIFESELKYIIELINEILPLNPDAFIVQDIGLARLLKFISDDIILHASTQMTISNYEAIKLTEDLKIKRYVLAREDSIDEIKEIKSKTDKELEVFVHGALCVSYSGQCLTSESMGGRSANRGQCAQSCRLPYKLSVDGEIKDLAEKKYLVSPKDLCGIDKVPELKQAGIDSLKIEGRLKSPEYVAETARAYKKSILNNMPDSNPCKNNLKILYSRDFFTGWLDGPNHQALVRADYSSHLGLEVGYVESVKNHSVCISSTTTPINGMGVVFTDFLNEKRTGDTIYKVDKISECLYNIELSNKFDFKNIAKGNKVFINSFPKLENHIQNSWRDKHNFKKIPVNVSASGSIDQPLFVTYEDNLNNKVTISSDSKLQIATSRPLSREDLAEKLAAFGGSCYYLQNFIHDLPKNIFINLKELKTIRQNAVAYLNSMRIKGEVLELKSSKEVVDFIENDPHSVIYLEKAKKHKLNLLIREPEQLNQLAGLPLNTIYLDFEYGRDYDEALKIVRSYGFKCGIATTRILKPGENAHLKKILRLKPDCILVRNLGALELLKDSNIELIGDFSLNITNSLTANWFLSKGLSSITPSYDLNFSQLKDLLQKIPGSKTEITIHQNIPAFHMEHCVFAAFLSKGTTYKDCGRPCEKHKVSLIDQNGTLHPLKADAECRILMFNGVTQSATSLILELIKLNVSSYRIEAAFDKSPEIAKKVSIYSNSLSGIPINYSVKNELNAVEKYGITDNQLINIKTYQDRKKNIELATPSQVADFLSKI